MHMRACEYTHTAVFEHKLQNHGYKLGTLHTQQVLKDAQNTRNEQNDSVSY
jgi:hypothetical protein